MATLLDVSIGQRVVFLPFTLMAIFSLLPAIVHGQAEGRMETDRPDQAECANVVRHGYFQMEAGFNANRLSGLRDWDLPTALIKYGIRNILEFRYISVLKSGAGNVRYVPVAAGLKVFLFKGKGWIPRTTVIGHYHFDDKKRDKSEYNPDHHSVGELMFTFQNDLTERFGIGYNFGPEFHSNGTTEWIYRVTPGLNVGERFFVYTELFGRVSRAAGAELWADGGIARYFSDDLKVDLSAGLNLEDPAERYAALGFSWRLKVSKR